MAWELDVTELDTDDCYLVQLGLVIPPHALTLSDATARRRVGAYRADVQAAADAPSRRWQAYRAIAEATAGADVRRAKFSAPTVDSLAAVDARWAFARALRADAQTGSDATRAVARALRQDDQAASDSRWSLVRAARDDGQASFDSISRAWTALRALAEAAAQGDAVARMAWLSKADTQASDDSLTSSWTALRGVPEAVLTAESIRQRAELLRADTQELAAALRSLVGSAKAEAQQAADAFSRLWQARPTHTESQATTDASWAWVTLARSEAQPSVDSLAMVLGLNLVCACLQLLEETLDPVWLAYRTVAEEQPASDERRTLVATPRQDAQAAADAVRAAARSVLQDAQEALDAFERACQFLRAWLEEQPAGDARTARVTAWRADIAAVVDALERAWDAARSLADNLAQLDALAKQAGIPVPEPQEAQDAFDRTWAAWLDLADEQGGAEALARSVAAVRAEAQATLDVLAQAARVLREDAQAMVDVLERAWEARSQHWADVYPADREATKAAGSVQHDEQAASDAWASRWQAVRRFAEPAALADAAWNAVRRLASELQDAWDRVASRAAAVWADAQELADELVRAWDAHLRLASPAEPQDAVAMAARPRFIEAPLSVLAGLARRAMPRVAEAVGLGEGVTPWDPTRPRRFSLRALFTAWLGRAETSAAARTLPWQLSTRWEGSRVLRMVAGEARTVRVRVEGTDGPYVIASYPAVRVLDERTGQEVASGTAEVNGDRVEYLFAPPGPGLYTLVFEIQVGTQRLIHRETVRVVE